MDGTNLTAQQIERIVKGCANYKRIQILDLVEKQPEISLHDISETLQIGLKTTSEHVRRLAVAGLVLKRSDGRWVRHTLTGRGVSVLAFLRTLE